VLLPLVLVVAGVGFAATLAAAVARKRSAGATISYEPTATSLPSVRSAYVSNITIPKGFTPEVVASVKKWSAARGLPEREVLATIYVESRGNPKAWANLSTEDSRGLMQVNVRAWAPKLVQYGMTVDDLWDVDKNIMIGTLIYKQYRDNVIKWIQQSGKPQSAPIDVLARLAYKGPAYVQKKILAGLDASRPYKNAEAAVANWKVAMTIADQVTSVA
jgi:hypothetical protein